MRIAISGPTDLTAKQMERVAHDFESRINQSDEVISGAAYGVDSIGARTAKRCGVTLTLTVPRDLWYNHDLRKLADCVIEISGSYMDRNDGTADIADSLIAYPPTSTEELRSGTWATIRRFRKRGKPVTIVSLDSLL